MGNGQKTVPPQHKLVEVLNKYIIPDLISKKPQDFRLGKVLRGAEKSA